jgi:hypothetical protein
MCNIYRLLSRGVFGAALSAVAAKTSKDRITPNARVSDLFATHV